MQRASARRRRRGPCSPPSERAVCASPCSPPPLRRCTRARRRRAPDWATSSTPLSTATSWARRGWTQRPSAGSWRRPTPRPRTPSWSVAPRAATSRAPWPWASARRCCSTAPAGIPRCGPASSPWRPCWSSYPRPRSDGSRWRPTPPRASRGRSSPGRRRGMARVRAFPGRHGPGQRRLRGSARLLFGGRKQRRGPPRVEGAGEHALQGQELPGGHVLLFRSHRRGDGVGLCVRQDVLLAALLQ
mmetsp:Transcript_43529/g.135433  ORF Transcript_43529/g.135433 Transcript_43529/m.135433 type:complete len:244 (-) Transcript_43529:357-1088(-)